jgi:hypothetical protein
MVIKIMYFKMAVVKRKPFLLGSHEDVKPQPKLVQKLFSVPVSELP